MNLFGNFTALVTPFNKNLTIDHNSLESICKFQIGNNSDGIVALGSTAESTSLDVYEKHKVMETITKTINGTIPIISGINAFTLEDALYQANARFLDGANALLVSPPPYIKPSFNGLLKYFTEIADHAYIPIILYNIPSRTGVNLNPELIEKLAAHPNIIGIKDASGDISYTQSVYLLTQQHDFSILAGNDNQLLPVLSIGGKGIISVIGNIFPQDIHKIISNYDKQSIKTSQHLYLDKLSLINALSLESNPIPIKYIMSKLGMIKPYFRAPLTKPSIKTKKLLNQVISSHFYQ